MHRILGPLLLIAGALYAQPPDTLWSRTYGGHFDDDFFLVSKTQLGYYLAGNETDSTFGDPKIAAMRTNLFGQVLWRTRIAEPNGGYVRTAIEHSNGILLLGCTLWGDSLGSPPILFALNSSGDSIWSYRNNLAEGGGCYALAERANGDILCCFNTWLTTGTRGVMVSLLSSSGELLSSNYYAHPDLAARYEAFHVAENQDGEIYIAGTFKPRPSFTDPVQERIWLMKLSSSGDSLWSVTYGLNNSQHYFESMNVLPNGNIRVFAFEYYNDFETSRIVLTLSSSGTLIEERVYNEYYTLRDIRKAPSFGYIGLTATEVLDTATFEFYLAPVLVRMNDIGEVLWTRPYRTSFDFFDLVAYSILPLPDGSYAVSGGLLLENPLFSTDSYIIVTTPDQTSGIDSDPRAPVPNSISVSAYPNPFNPTTAISFDLPSSSHVTLKVFNSLGQQVTQLADEHFSAGTHEVTFDASQLSSGLYFYSLSALDQTHSGKLLLLK